MRDVFKAFALITQLGITMITPILLCAVLGYFIDKRFESNWFIILLLLGILAGFRNVYHLTKSFFKKDEEGKD